MKRVAIYYSYTGNTKKVVERIKEKLSCEVVEIIPVIPYSEDYQTVVDEAERKVPQNDQPEIKPMEIDFSSYDEMILASPVWWYTVASPVNTFLHQVNWQGKRILPVITNGGWVGHTIEDIQKITSGVIKDPLILEYDGSALKNEEDLVRWLENREKDQNKKEEE